MLRRMVGTEERRSDVEVAPRAYVQSVVCGMPIQRYLTCASRK